MPVPYSKDKYPWGQMEVGDAVFIETEKGQSPFKLKRKVNPSARYYVDKTGKRFINLKDDENNGVRVRRVEQGYQYRM